MDKFTISDIIKKSKLIVREDFIQEKCYGKTVLDMGCVRHSASFAIEDPKWLHKRIKEVAKKVTGIDYLPQEVERLNKSGYEIILWDVTKRLNMVERFDVIVAADLIEHLVNFEGFLENCKNLLNSKGILIITTANPFYSGEFHYLAFKRNFLNNPEHTCWIDPLCLEQLSRRFGFGVREIHYLKNSWKLESIICETKKHIYDIHNDMWKNNSFGFKLFRLLFGSLFAFFYLPYRVISGSNTILVRYSDYLAVLAHEDDNNIL